MGLTPLDSAINTKHMVHWKFGFYHPPSLRYMLQCIRELSVFANTINIWCVCVYFKLFGVFTNTSNINGVLEYLINCGSLLIKHLLVSDIF